MRAYKTVNDTYIEPISFTVPRRAETFQSDIYPPAVGLKPAMSAKDWLSGKTALPPKIDLESVYEGNAPAELPAHYTPPAAAPAAAPAPAPVSKPAPKKEPEPRPATVRPPPPSATHQKQSVSAMASKYRDDEDEDEDDEAETSSFEEVTRPQPRTSGPVRPPSPFKATPPVQQKPPSPLKSPPPPSAPVVKGTPAPAATSPWGTSVEASLEQIKQLLETQTKIISAQSENIGQLTAEMDVLKKRVGSGSQDQSERIRQLELELEAARS